MGGFIREELRSALQGGAKLLVIDPKKIDIAKRADLWLNPKPQSDGALAMGMSKVIVEENLYDADFVAKWTVGFEKLKEEVGTFFNRSIDATIAFKERVTRLLEEKGGSLEDVVLQIKAEQYDTNKGIKQPEIPYLINLRAQVRHLAQKSPMRLQ